MESCFNTYIEQDDMRFKELTKFTMRRLKLRGNDALFVKENVEDTVQGYVLEIFLLTNIRKMIIDNCLSDWEKTNSVLYKRVKAHAEQKAFDDRQQHSAICTLIEDMQSKVISYNPSHRVGHDFFYVFLKELDKEIRSKIADGTITNNLDSIKKYWDEMVYDICWLIKLVERYDKLHDFGVPDLQQFEALYHGKYIFV